MKPFALAAIASLALVSAAAAQSSSTTVITRDTGTTGAVTIQPEVRTKVREFVTTRRAPSVAVPSGFTVSTGAILPETVEVEAFPADVGVTQYRYAVVGGQTVLVDPGSRRIVEVIR